jgi:subtilase family serine protease
MDKGRQRSKGFRLIPVYLAILFSATLAWAQQSSPDTVPPIHTQGNAQKGVVGLTPQQVRHAYGFDKVSSQGDGQVIALIEAFNHPQIEKDLGVFSQAFGLPPCTTANGCFTQVSVNGKNLGTNTLWALEISLDVEWAHAMAPNARIILVQSPSGKLDDMLQGVDLAVRMGADVVSMSWGAPEFAGEAAYDGHFLAPGVIFVASSGDSGNPGFYPAASPFVTGVGGTSLNLDSNGNILSETAWSGSGGGISSLEPNLFQSPFDGSAGRGIPDVAYNADPAMGFAVYDSTPYHGAGGWIQVGGTSAGPPQWSAIFAIANSMRASAGKSPLGFANIDLYKAAASAYASDYDDAKSGTNGTCGTVCSAGTGYDFVTGLGSPRAGNLIKVLQN